MESIRTRTTERLLAVGKTGQTSAKPLFPLIYRELRALAHRYLSGERRGHTLQPTELVHEAYLRMVDIERVDWRGKTHFYAVAARQMRRILVDHARSKGADKRGGGDVRVTLDERLAVDSRRPDDMIALDQALARLAELDLRRSRVAELKLFGGLSSRDIAVEVSVSERTVSDDWRFAKAWLSRELGSTER